MPRRARLTPATMVAETTVGRLVKEKGQGEASPLVGGRVPLFLLNPGCHWEWQPRAGAEVDQGGADKPETFPGGGPEVEPQRPLGRSTESKALEAWRQGGSLWAGRSAPAPPALPAHPHLSRGVTCLSFRAATGGWCLAGLPKLGWVSPVILRAFRAGVRARLRQAHLPRTPFHSL